MLRCGFTGCRSGLVSAIAALVFACAAAGASAETLESALVQAYQNNPTLNSQRAALRAVDENVPQALAGYRPRVTVTATGGEQSLSSTSVSNPSRAPGTPSTYLTQSGYNAPYGASATISQTL